MEREHGMGDKWFGAPASSGQQRCRAGTVDIIPCREERCFEPCRVSISEKFIASLLVRNIDLEEDLSDQLGPEKTW